MNVNGVQTHADSTLQSQRDRQRCTTRGTARTKLERLPRYTVTRRRTQRVPADGAAVGRIGRGEAVLARHVEKAAVTLAVLLILVVYAGSLLQLGGLV